MAAIQCETLGELSARFDSLISGLKTRFVLRDAIGVPECNVMLRDVDSSLAELGHVIALTKAEIKKLRTAEQEIEVMKQDVADLHKRALHARENLPSYLPKQQQQQQQQARQGTQPTARSKIPMTPVHKKKQAMYTPLLSGSCAAETAQAACSPGVPSVAQIKNKAPTLFIPTLEYLTVNEFESVPKYQRGRLTYEQINSIMDEFNTALTAKYKLLATPRCKQNDRIRKAIWEYKEQESKDTKGLFFITDKDLKTTSKFKMDSVGRAVLTILRHCNRVKEVRSKGIVRYAAVM